MANGVGPGRGGSQTRPYHPPRRTLLVRALSLASVPCRNGRALAKARIHSRPRGAARFSSPASDSKRYRVLDALIRPMMTEPVMTESVKVRSGSFCSTASATVCPAHGRGFAVRGVLCGARCFVWRAVFCVEQESARRGTRTPTGVTPLAPRASLGRLPRWYLLGLARKIGTWCALRSLQ
jgi:hypothetical protein